MKVIELALMHLKAKLKLKVKVIMKQYSPAWNGGGQLALERGRVYRKAGRATLQTRITADAKPVPDARLLDEH